MTGESLPPTTGATSPAPRCTSPPGVGICKLSAPSSKPVCLGSALFQRCVSSRVLAHSMALMRTTVCQTLTFIHSTQPILCAVAANLPPPRQGPTGTVPRCRAPPPSEPPPATATLTSLLSSCGLVCCARSLSAIKMFRVCFWEFSCLFFFQGNRKKIHQKKHQSLPKRFELPIFM